MIKKLITSGLVLVWISSLALAGYRFFEPRAAEAVTENKVAIASMDAQGRSINNDEAQTPLVAAMDQDDKTGEESGTEEYHYYLFCSPDDSNCIYLNDYVLKPLATELEVSQIEILEYVDISTLSSEWTPQRLKNQWGFDNFPAFVAIATDSEGNRSILSVLQWIAEEPIDQNDLKNWMIENGIWTGPVEEQGELIEQPGA